MDDSQVTMADQSAPGGDVDRSGSVANVAFITTIVLLLILIYALASAA